MALDLRFGFVAALAVAACSSPDPQNPVASSSPTAVAPPPTSAVALANSAEPVKPTPSSNPKSDPKAEPIGQATLLADGTIVLDLHRPAEAQIKYAKSDPKYQSILDHVGPLEVGKPKLVLPWPDDIDDAKVAEAVATYVKSKKGWAPDAWKETIVGTDADGNIAVTVTFKKDGETQVDGGGKSFQLLLAPKDYSVVREVHFQ